MKQRILPLAVLAIAFPASAFAQATVGTGFPIGEKSRIHTNLDLAAGYDSNFQRLPEGQDGGDTSDVKMQIRPGLEVEVPGTSVALSLRTKLFIEHFFDASDTKFGGDVGADLRLGSEQSTIGFELKDTLARTPTFFADLGAVGADEIRFQQWQNRGSARFVLRPGGGALEFRLGYGNELHIYDNLPNSQRHAAEFEAKLKFLPKTALIFAADMSFFDATQERGLDTNPATPYNVAVGLQGQITSRFSTLLRVGFGDTLSWEDEHFGTLSDSNIRTLIASANLTYAFMPGSSVSVGYDRAVRPVIVLDTYTSDAVNARVILAVGERLAFGVYGMFENRSFGGGQGDSRLLAGDARIEYWFFEFLKGGLVYQVIDQESDGSAQLESFTRHQGLIVAGLHY